MGFSKVKYNSGEEIFRIRVENSNGGKIDDWVIMRHDFPRWVHTVCAKYGLNLGKPKTDLDWAN